MITKFSVFVFIILSSGYVVGANEPEMPFSWEDCKQLRVNWRGQKIIANDMINYLGKDGFNASSFKEIKDNCGWLNRNIWNDGRPISYRREVALAPDGKELEINFQITQPAYENLTRSDNRLGYVISVPIDAVNGMEWSAVTGRSAVATRVNGIVERSLPNAGIKYSGGIRCISFKGTRGSIFFDLNPEGVGSYSDWGFNLIRGQWHIVKDGDNLEFRVEQMMGIAGGSINSKVIIFEGSIGDYFNRHSQKTFFYFDNLPITKQFQFGSGLKSANYISVGKKCYSELSGFGWYGSNIEKIVERRFAPSGVFYGYACSGYNSVFKCLLSQPGLYVVSVASAGEAKSAGPFGISCNGKKIQENINVAPNTLKTVTWTQWLESGNAQIEFTGNWQISTLSFQLLLHQKEDFKIKRSFWRVDNLFEPSVMYRSSYFHGEPQYAVSISEVPLSVNVSADSEKIVSFVDKKVLLPKSDDERMKWRYDSLIDGIGINVLGNFDEFNTRELIQRRINELKAQNIRCIILNGLHSRLLFAEHWGRVEKNVTMICEIAHRENMKVIDHFALTELWNWNNGYRTFCEHLDWTQRAIDGIVPTRGLCPNNPDFRKFFFDWFTRYVKNTGLDGAMIDEIGFHGPKFCGCRYCRELFFRESGLRLPLDETSTLLTGKSSNLYKTWLSWRIKTIGDFYVALRGEISRNQSTFTFMNYTTFRLFYQNDAAYNNGISITEAARACDFLGIEQMSRNVMISYRPTFALIQLVNSIREHYKTPFFGLVYSGNVDIAYFGWALNNMNMQSTWFTEPVLSSSSSGCNIMSFKENMDLSIAKTVTDCAILLSLQTKDSAAPDVLGFLEHMNDIHMPVSVLVEPSLIPENLKKYKNLFVPSAANLSNIQIDEILSFAKNGGNVLFTADTGFGDEVGNSRKIWPLAKIFSIENPLPETVAKGMTFEEGCGRKIPVADEPPSQWRQGLPMAIYKISILPGSSSTVFLNIIDKDGRKTPVGIMVQYGKGRLFYIAAQIGIGNVERYEIQTNKPWVFSRNQPHFDLMSKIITMVSGEAKNFIPIDIPERVLCTVYQQRKNGNTSTMVHLLNATGVNIKPGELVKSNPPLPSYPMVDRDIAFMIKCNHEIKDAYAVSPDFQGRKRVGFVKDMDGFLRVTIAPELIKTYVIIFLNEK